MDAVKLAPDEVRALSHEANVFSLIMTVEHLERAYVNGRITPACYEKECLQLIGQFKTVQRALSDSYPDLRQFMRDHKMDCSLAEDRLLVSGVPATLLYASVDQTGSGNEAAKAFDMSTNFITLLDTLRLGDSDVDILFPQLKDVVASLAKFPLPESNGAKLRDWMATMNSMAASDRLSDAQIRQITFDTEQCFHAFKEWLDTRHSKKA